MPRFCRRPRTEALRRHSVKLLLDENLSDRIVPQIAELFPGSAHVKTHRLIHTDDGEIWEFAKTNGFTLVSKDADFHQRSLLRGHPPKLVFLRLGNCPTPQIVSIIRRHWGVMLDFETDVLASVLILSDSLPVAG